MTHRPAFRAAACLTLGLGLLCGPVTQAQAQTAAAPATAAVASAAATPAPAPTTAVPATPAPATPAAGPATAPDIALTTSPPADLSIRALIRRADRVVQGVMLLLILASILSWTIMLAKSLELWRAGQAVRAGLRLAEADAPDSTHGMPRPLLLMRHAVRAEIAASEGAAATGTKERLASRLRRIETRLGRRAQRGTGLLATIGSTSPFVGLFGTVWGIMNSFVGIAALHTTNLAVVAPGIAEALLATAAGLIAAIPAVVIYNLFARWAAAYRHGLGDLGEIVLRHAARALDLGDQAPDRARRALSLAAE